MRGEQTYLNYARSGKWDFLTPSNKFTWPSEAQSFMVPEASIRMPAGVSGWRPDLRIMAETSI